MVTELFINDNKLRSLPSDFFLAFPSLQWLDLRNNRLEDIFEPSPFLNSSVSQYQNVIHTIACSLLRTNLFTYMGTSYFTVF